jgi:cellulose synthase (UDP-forming)
MIQVLGTYTPRVIGQFRLGQALQFLFAETWYPLFGLSMLMLFLTRWQRWSSVRTCSCKPA